MIHPTLCANSDGRLHGPRLEGLGPGSFFLVVRISVPVKAVRITSEIIAPNSPDEVLTLDSGIRDPKFPVVEKAI